MTASSTSDKRKLSRRSKTLRFRFELDGREHRAVCPNISASGAFLKASAIPESGQQLVLREVFRGSRDVGLRIRCEVVRAISRATLEHPETGFAVDFVEAWTAGDIPPLQDVANIINPGMEHRFEQTERDGVAITLYRFPEVTAGTNTARTHRTAAYDDLPEIDLASELARLDRQQRRTGTHSVAQSPQASPPKPRPSLRAATVIDVGSVSHHFEDQPGPTESRDSNAAMTGPAAESADPSPEHHRRGKFGGLLGMFGFGKEGASDISSSGLDEAGFTSPGEVSNDVHVAMTDPSLVQLRWKDQSVDGRVKNVSRAMISVTVIGETPVHYERVHIVPAFPNMAAPALRIVGTVTRIREAQTGTSKLVLVRISEIEEHDESDAMSRYLEHFA